MWFCTYYHLCSIERLRMKLKVGSICIGWRQLSKLEENEGKMCINKQKDGGAEKISSTFTYLREDHCRGWCTVTSLGVFPSIWMGIGTTSAVLEMNGQEGKANVSCNKACVLHLEILIEEGDLVRALFSAAASAISKPTLAIQNTGRPLCLSNFVVSADAQ